MTTWCCVHAMVSCCCPAWPGEQCCLPSCRAAAATHAALCPAAAHSTAHMPCIMLAGEQVEAKVAELGAKYGAGRVKVRSARAACQQLQPCPAPLACMPLISPALASPQYALPCAPAASICTARWQLVLLCLPAHAVLTWLLRILAAGHGLQCGAAAGGARAVRFCGA